MQAHEYPGLPLRVPQKNGKPGKMGGNGGNGEGMGSLGVNGGAQGEFGGSGGTTEARWGSNGGRWGKTEVCSRSPTSGHERVQAPREPTTHSSTGGGVGA